MSEQVEAAALDRAVEAMARGGLPEAFPAPLAPAATKGGLEIVIEEGDWPDEDIEWAERVMRAALQAADDHLREHYWAEFRERLLGGDCVDAVARDVWQKRNQHPWEKVPEKFKAMLRDNTRRHLSVLATTQHKGGSQ